MPRLHLQSSQFALVAGRRRNHGETIASDIPGRWTPLGSSTQLYLLVEHAAANGQAHELCQIVVREAQRLFREEERRGGGIPAVLSRMVTILNQTMWSEAQHLPLHKRLPIGLVAVAINGRDAYLCQVAAGQLLISRGDDVLGLPELGFWYELCSGATETVPGLGQAAEIAPVIRRCRLEGRDQLLLCTSNLGRLVDASVAPMLTRQPLETMVNQLFVLAESYGLQHVHGLVLQVPAIRAASTVPVPLTLERVLVGEAVPEELVARASDSLAAAVAATPIEEPAVAVAEHLPANVVRLYSTPPLGPLSAQQAPAAPRIEITEEVIGVAPVAVAAGGARTPQRRPTMQPQPNRARWFEALTASLIEKPMALASAGGPTQSMAPLAASTASGESLRAPTRGRAGGGERRRRPAAPRPAPRWRRLLAWEWTPLLLVLTTVIVLAAVALLVSQFLIGSPRAGAGPEVERGAVSASGGTASETSTTSATSPTAPAAGAVGGWRPTRVDRYETAPPSVEAPPVTRATDLAQADAANRVVRYSQVNAIADLTASGSPASTPKQIVVGPRALYLLDPYSSTLYIQEEGKEMTPLLAKGWVVNRQKVGELVGATWRGTTLAVIDRERAYTLDGPNGTWRTATLAGTNIGPGARSIDSFDNNLYVLDNASRQIFKYPAGIYARSPQQWLRPNERVDLAGAVDMAIDGRIYILTANGQILVLNQGTLEKTITPPVTPPLATPATIASPSGSTYLYVADTSGRILKLTKDGALVQQFMAAEGGAIDLNGLSHIAVNEATRTIYAVVGNRVIRLIIPQG